MQKFVPFEVGHNQDGRLEVFRYDGTSYASSHTWQVAPNVGWGGWSPGPLTRITSGPVATASNADGRVEVFYPGANGIQHVWQTAPNNGWDATGYALGLPHGRCDHLHAVTNADGRLEVFRVSYPNTDYPRGAIWHIWQTAPNNGWSQAERIDLGTHTIQRGLGCFMGPGGRLELHYTDNQANNVVRRLALTASGWREAHTHVYPATVTTYDQQVYEGARYTWTPVQVNNQWYVRRSRNDATTANASADLLDVPAHATGEELRCLFDRWGNEHNFQVSGFRGLPGTNEVEARLRWSCYSPSRTAAWHDPTFLWDWGTAVGSWRVATNQDGRLEVFAARSDGTIWHRWQIAPGQPAAGWSGWNTL